jgi:hypothetical protein
MCLCNTYKKRQLDGKVSWHTKLIRSNTFIVFDQGRNLLLTALFGFSVIYTYSLDNNWLCGGCTVKKFTLCFSFASRMAVGSNRPLARSFRSPCLLRRIELRRHMLIPFWFCAIHSVPMVLSCVSSLLVTWKILVVRTRIVTVNIHDLKESRCYIHLLLTNNSIQGKLLHGTSAALRWMCRGEVYLVSYFFFLLVGQAVQVVRSLGCFASTDHSDRREQEFWLLVLLSRSGLFDGISCVTFWSFCKYTLTKQCRSRTLPLSYHTDLSVPTPNPLGQSLHPLTNPCLALDLCCRCP